MQVNCPDGHQAASGRATFEARPAISRENASSIAYVLFPDREAISWDWRSSDAYRQTEQCWKLWVGGEWKRNLFGHFHWPLTCHVSPFVPLLPLGIIRGLEGKQYRQVEIHTLECFARLRRQQVKIRWLSRNIFNSFIFPQVAWSHWHWAFAYFNWTALCPSDLVNLVSS